MTKPMTPEKLYEAAVRARETLLRHGWRRGDYGTKGGPKCAVGALRYGISGTPEWEVGVNDAASEVLDVLVRPQALAFVWNDAKDRTVEHVLALIDEVASLALSEMAATPEPRP